MPAKKVEGLNELDPLFLFCRINHLFDFRGDTNIERQRGVILRWVRMSECLRCGAEKEEVIDGRTFKVVRNKIHYPDGYLSSGGRISKSEVRREQMSREGYRVGKIEKE